MHSVQIGNKYIGDCEPCFVIAEIGINHNGNLSLAKKLVSLASIAGCDAVKFQKRTVDIVYSQEELNKPRKSPFGNINNDLKRGLEFNLSDYSEISRWSHKNNILWFASCWDEDSVDLIYTLNPPCYKIASASLTDDNLLKHTRSKGKPIILSTGMSTIKQIDHAVDILGVDDLILMHCNSSYPAKTEELNLRCIKKLKYRYGVPVGYSGHEVGLQTTLAAATLGANVIERHITLDRTMWGSDQKSSIEGTGLLRLVRDIRIIELALGDGYKRVYNDEIEVMKKLRRK